MMGETLYQNYSLVNSEVSGLNHLFLTDLSSLILTV